MNALANQKTTTAKKFIFNIKSMTQIGMLSALAIILMLFEFPLPFAPAFYKLDFSELPVIIGAFAIHPAAGAVIELVKILLNFLVNGSITAGVGEIANFFIGCFLVIPASVIYHHRKCRKNALMGLITGTFLMTAAGCILNAYVLLPAYAAAFQWDIAKLTEMGTAINPAINSLWTFILFAVAPFNFLKGVLVSAITMLIYKKVSVILKGRM